MNFNTFINEGKFDHIADLVKSLHFEIDPKTAEEKKIELGKKQGEVSKRKQIESAEYSLRRFRKSINFGDGTYLGVFIPGSYDAATSTLGDGPHKKAAKKIKWNQKKYSQWLEDMASNGGAENAFDMAQNAKNEPGLIDWVEKNFRDDDPIQRIKWDIEGFAESVEEAKLSVIHKAAKKGSYPVSLVVIENGKVVKQELVETPQIVPAAFNQLKKEYPNAIIHVESKTGERLFTEAKEDFEPHMMYDPETGKGYKAEKQEDHDRMDKLGYVHEKPEINEAENYLTGEFKVGDKIKTNFGEWKVIEIDYKPGKSFIAPFIFKGKDMKRVNIPNPPKTNKNAVGYKVTDGAKYPTIGFLYQYKDITKLATVGVDESVVTEDLSMKIGKVVAITKYNPRKNRKELVDVKITDYVKKPGSKDFVEYELKGKKSKVSIDVFKSIMESVVTEAKAYNLKASEFGGDTFSAAYNVKGEPTWRVHSTYAIDQVSGENNPDERDVVFFEAMPINNEIIIKIGGINNLKRTGATVGNNFGATIEEWKNDPEGIAKEASEFLTDATHLKWINKKARSQGQVIKWALKDDYSSVIEDLVNKALGLKESVNEEKIKYDKGSTYQSSGHWTVVVDSNSSGLDIRVNHSAGWRLDPHDEKEETFELLDNGRQRATLYFKSGNIDKFAKLMFDLNDRTTHGNATKLTAKDYADIIRVWIDMRKANESVSESYTINDIYNLIARHRFDNDYKKLSAKDKKWVENDAEERGFNESFTNLEFEMIYTSLLEKLGESSEKEIKQNDMKHVKLFEQFINEASVYFRSLSPEVQELWIAYHYAVEDTPEGDKFSEKIIELGLSDSNICPDFDVNNFSGGLIKFRGDKRKAIEHLANFTDLGKVKVPTGDYPTATRFIMDMITQNTGKNVRLEYKGSFGKSPADLIEYDPEVVSQPSANTIHPHESDVVLIKNFNRSKIRKVLDICIKEGWIKKPVYNW